MEHPEERLSRDRGEDRERQHEGDEEPRSATEHGRGPPRSIEEGVEDVSKVTHLDGEEHAAHGEGPDGGEHHERHPQEGTRRQERGKRGGVVQQAHGVEEEPERHEQVDALPRLQAGGEHQQQWGGGLQKHVIEGALAHLLDQECKARVEDSFDHGLQQQEERCDDEGFREGPPGNAGAQTIEDKQRSQCRAGPDQLDERIDDEVRAILSRQRNGEPRLGQEHPKELHGSAPIGLEASDPTTPARAEHERGQHHEEHLPSQERESFDTRVSTKRKLYRKPDLVTKREPVVRPL